MSFLKDRRIVALIGAVCVLLLVALIGVVVTRRHGGDAPAAAQASTGGLQIEQGTPDSRANATKPLRCFVNGQFVGMEPVADCAKKNGVAAQALDVGLDPSTGAAPNGTLAPAVQAPPPAASSPPAAAPDSKTEEAEASPAGAPGECLRYAPEGWRAVSNGASLAQCARTLFDGRCERSGDAIYGRWGNQTLRLVPGRVEISGDNHTFHALVPQNPQDCSLPPG